jgi:hypothetical protein
MNDLRKYVVFLRPLANDVGPFEAEEVDATGYDVIGTKDFSYVSFALGPERGILMVPADRVLRIEAREWPGKGDPLQEAVPYHVLVAALNDVRRALLADGRGAAGRIKAAEAILSLVGPADG